MIDVPARRHWLALFVLPGVLLALGLGDFFVLDDYINFRLIEPWLLGDVSLAAATGDIQRVALGRRLSHLSFLLNAWMTGLSPVSFKLVNILLHLVVAWLLVELLRALAPPRREAPWWPLWGLAAVLLWSLMPMHVSTVLYAVQRMTVLSALFSVLALIAFVRGRQLAGLRPGQAHGLLFLAFPLACLLSVLCKENGALTPLFALLIEVCLLRRDDAAARRTVAWFFGLFLLVPGALALALLGVNPSRFLGYSGREFSMGERLITQPVILVEYLRGILLPLPKWLHLYREGYPVASLGAGLVATAFWLAWVVTAVLLRQRRPWIAFGLLWFVAGHVLESSVIPLELYFEHRNYLPSFGLALALLGFLVPSADALNRVHARPSSDSLPTSEDSVVSVVRWWRQFRARCVESGLSPMGLAVALVLVVSFAFGTAHRAWQWRDLDRLLATEGPSPPEVSRRLQIDRAIRAVAVGRAGDVDRALAFLASGSAGDRAAAAQWRAIFGCDQGRFEPESLEALRVAAPSVTTHNHASYMNLLVRRVERGDCEHLDAEGLLPVLGAWRAASTQPAAAYGPRQLAVQTAHLLFLRGDPAAALDALPDTRRTGFDAGVLRVRSLLALGRNEEARAHLRKMQEENRGRYRSRTQTLARLQAEAR